MTSSSPPPWSLSATDALARLDDGSLSARALVQSCLSRIAERDPEVQAWAWIDAAHALRQADACDQQRASGQPLGRLHGLPVAVKDNIDTADMPTECGTPLHAGRQPTLDATVVARLRAEGAVILGKTVTTELAYYTPGKTRNPHDLGHTPGGSSSGSAAAVACGMVPLALGTQTNGSVIRPAAFCGVIGHKPGFGRIPREGVLLTSSSLDQVGVFGRTLDDVALAGACLESSEPHPTRWPHHQPARIGWLRSDLDQQLEPGVLPHFQALAASLGDACQALELGDLPVTANAHQKAVMQHEMATNLGDLYDRGAALMSPPLRQLIEDGRAIGDDRYRAALAGGLEVGERIDALFERFDVLMQPSAPGAAPRGLDHTGSPLFCSMASLLGLPAISLPLLRDGAGLPLGVQLLARRGEERTLLQAADWLMRRTA